MKIFISHSSKDSFVINFVDYLTSLGINSNDIFCSSLEGQGVKNGQRISDSVKEAFNSSELVIYLISHNFIGSSYCMQELGALWAINESKDYFIFKFEDVKNDEIKGFIDTSYKYNFVNSDGLASLYDVIFEKFKLQNKQAVINRAANKLLESLKEEIELLVEEKDKTTKELEEERRENLEKQYDDLSVGEKEIIATIFYSKDAVEYYTMSNGTIGLLEAKFFVFKASNVSRGFLQFAYALQPWVITFIKGKKNIQNELKNILKQKGTNTNDDPYGFY